MNSQFLVGDILAIHRYKAICGPLSLDPGGTVEALGILAVRPGDDKLHDYGPIGAGHAPILLYRGGHSCTRRALVPGSRSISILRLKGQAQPNCDWRETIKRCLNSCWSHLVYSFEAPVQAFGCFDGKVMRSWPKNALRCEPTQVQTAEFISALYRMVGVDLCPSISGRWTTMADILTSPCLSLETMCISEGEVEEEAAPPPASAREPGPWAVDSDAPGVETVNVPMTSTGQPPRL